MRFGCSLREKLCYSKMETSFVIKTTTHLKTFRSTSNTHAHTRSLTHKKNVRAPCQLVGFGGIHLNGGEIPDFVSVDTSNGTSVVG